MADYAACYRGLPRLEDPWPLVLALLQRMPRFEGRARLRLLDSVSNAIAGAFGSAREVQVLRAKLERQAYPDGDHLTLGQQIIRGEPTDQEDGS